VIAVDVRTAAEDPEVGVFVFVGLFGLKFVVVGINFEIVEEDDVTNFDTGGEIFPAIAPEVDLKGFLLLGVVDDFKFLSVVPVVFIAIGVGAVDDESDG